MKSVKERFAAFLKYLKTSLKKGSPYTHSLVKNRSTRTEGVEYNYSINGSWSFVVHLDVVKYPLEEECPLAWVTICVSLYLTRPEDFLEVSLLNYGEKEVEAIREFVASWYERSVVEQLESYQRNWSDFERRVLFLKDMDKKDIEKKDIEKKIT